jgi:superfamily II DNA/RNA helicase
MKPRSIGLLNFDQFEFNPNIHAAIRAAGYSHPTPIQKQAIPLVLQGRDVLGLAKRRLLSCLYCSSWQTAHIEKCES